MTTIINGSSPSVTFSDGTTQTSGITATAGVVGVASGGTGVSTLTANNVLLGNGTGALQVVAPSTSGNVLVSNGTTWVSQAPAGGGVTSLNGNTGALNGWQNIATGTFTSATAVNIGSLPTGYRQFIIVYNFKIVSGSNSFYHLRYSIDNGSTYVATNTYWGVCMYNNIAGATAPSGFSNGGTSIQLYDLAFPTNNDISLSVALYQPVSTTNAIISFDANSTNADTSTVTIKGTGRFATTSYVNGMQLTRISGTSLITGQYTVYGSK